MSAEPARLRGFEGPALPVRFTAADAAADGQIRTIEIDRDRVLMRRSVRGMSIRFNLPHQAFRGVSLRLGADGCAVGLEHRDPGLSITLASSDDETEMFQQWEAWASTLALPMMVGAAEGDCCEVGAEAAAVASPRRRRRNAIRHRRPTIFLRRKAGNVTRALPLHRNTDLFARDSDHR